MDFTRKRKNEKEPSSIGNGPGALYGRSYAFKRQGLCTTGNGLVYYYDVPASEIRDHYTEWRVFLEYNLQHEPCQHYQDPPPGYFVRGCNVYRVAPPVATTATTETVTQTVPEKAAVTQSASASTYTIHFGFDKSDIPANERSVVGKAAQEIQKDNPSEVVVSGYTSTTGTVGYNQKLSERRSEAVTHELVSDGVAANIIIQKDYGEMQQAVETGNNVEMPANRRVVIEFTQ